jgi:hypothetical protein
MVFMLHPQSMNSVAASPRGRHGTLALRTSLGFDDPVPETLLLNAVDRHAQQWLSRLTSHRARPGGCAASRQRRQRSWHIGIDPLAPVCEPPRARNYTGGRSRLLSHHQWGGSSASSTLWSLSSWLGGCE